MKPGDIRSQGKSRTKRNGSILRDPRIRELYEAELVAYMMRGAVLG